MTEVFHERLKAPIPTRELERRSKEIRLAMKREQIDVILAQNITQYMGGTNRWLTDTTAEINYPQSSFIPLEGEIGYIACSGPPLDLYPPSHLLRIGKPWDANPYFSPFRYTWDWEGKMFVKWCEENKPKKIGIAGTEIMMWNYYDYIKKHLSGVEIVDASLIIDEIRALKSEDEIVAIENAVALQDKVMGYIPAIAQAGVREYEVKNKIMKLIMDHGGEEFVIFMGSAPRGEQLNLYPGFFQNRTLQKGDVLYVRVECSGPGGMFTTVGRMFSIGCEPSASLLKDWEEAVAAQEKLAGMLQVGMDPQVIFAQYNEYLASKGYAQEQGLFAYGQGYDWIERPSIQPGETMKLAKDMCMAVNTNLVSAERSVYAADSYLIKPNGAQKLHKTPLVVFRT